MVNVTMLFHNRPRLTVQALKSLERPQPKSEADAGNIGWSKRPDLPQVTLTVAAEDCTDGAIDEVRRNITPAWTETELWLHNAPPRGTGSARNAVIRASEERFGRGDFLYLSDNDVFFYPAIFEKLVPIFKYAKTLGFKILGAVNHPYHRPVNSFPVYGGGKEIISRIEEVQALALQSWLLDWETWDRYGPFDDTPVGRVRMSEDVSFTNKVRADGGKIGVVSPSLAVNTGLTDSFGEKIPGWELVLKEAPMGVYIE